MLEMARSLVVYGSLLVFLRYFLPAIFVKIRGKKPAKILEKNWKKDNVYLYQIPGTKSMSSVSPFCIKIETFLRLHQIPFERRDSILNRGENGKVPFIELNGEQTADSNLIIPKLVEHFHIQEYKNETDANIGHAISSMVDFRTFNIFVHYKTTYSQPIFMKALAAGFVPDKVVELLTPIVGEYLRSEMHRRVNETIGIFTDDQFNELAKKDLEVYKGLLGDKKYLFGDKMTTADCTLFGHLSATFYLRQDSFPMRTLSSEKFASLASNCRKMLCSILDGATFILFIQYVLPFVIRKFRPKKTVTILEKNWKKDVPPGTKVLPSVSPFCIKVETFLRLHKIPFERRPTLFYRGINEKFPSIELNGEHIADSELMRPFVRFLGVRPLIIYRLLQHFKIKVFSNSYDESIGHALTSMVDKRTFNLFLHYKITRTPANFLKAMLGTAMPELTPVIAAIKSSIYHGKIFGLFGEYSDADFDVLVHKDLVAYRDFLGQKKIFLLGDSPTTLIVHYSVICRPHSSSLRTVRHNVRFCVENS
ncbi:hypothetical protein PRIPAC_79915 [Pristionchus pacificus]|uniref:Glutathione S-transferase n=1 Tax=Pristionchus pacificus TaxID=54126 RepID=A0A2A6C490_PRIPA|nr:hypothetical protein PRIPAC_79915 [Pristionchus pacificus]|eukprot:PDM72908.1 Glutathione S-transferase [Pristionchus pacificus]